jgi:hypothetical protein
LSQRRSGVIEGQGGKNEFVERSKNIKARGNSEGN